MALLPKRLRPFRKSNHMNSCFFHARNLCQGGLMLFFSSGIFQYDYCSMIPNYSLLLRKPPPTTKGQSSMETVLETLPSVSESVNFVAMSIVLTGNYTDKVSLITIRVGNNSNRIFQPHLFIFSFGQIFLGNYPDERFDEAVPKQVIKDFQTKLAQFSEEIAGRNAERNPPYVYMDPAQMENSIAI